MVEGSTTPKDKLLRLQGKTIVQRSSHQYLLLWEWGPGGEQSLTSHYLGHCLAPSQCHPGSCWMLLGHNENNYWRMTCFFYFGNAHVLVPALRTLDSITLIPNTLFFFYIIIISHHFSCVLWTTTGAVFRYCSKCLQDPTIICTSKFSPKLGS